MIRSYGDKSERVRTHVIRVVAPVPIYRKGSQHSASSIRLLCIQGKEMKNHATFTYVADVLVPVLDSCRAGIHALQPSGLGRSRRRCSGGARPVRSGQSKGVAVSSDQKIRFVWFGNNASTHVSRKENLAWTKY